MKIVRILVLLAILVVVLIAGVIFNDYVRSEETPGAVWSAQMLNGPQLQARRWQSIGETHLLSQTVDVSTVQGWYIKPIPITAQSRFRFTLRGRFAASEPIFFVVISPQQVTIMQQGYPPLLEYEAREGQPISTPWPADNSFYGFVRPRANPSGFPTSLSEVALLMLHRALEQSRPPARVTVELSVAGECLCTDAEALAQRMK